MFILYMNKHKRIFRKSCTSYTMMHLKENLNTFM